jgi:hypothetical protein
MVILKPSKIDKIQDSLENLLEFFKSKTSHSTDEKTLQTVEHDLISLESKLQTFGEYRRGRNQNP